MLTCCHTSTDETGTEGDGAGVVVQTASSVRGTAIERLELAGTLQPLPGLDVKLGALAAGRLVELRKGEGDPVKKGELIGRIDPAPLLGQVEQARAQLEQARAQEQNAALRQQRSARAVDAGVAARQELEDAQLGSATAAAQVRSAQGALAAAENQLSRSELRAPFDGLIARVFAAQGEPIDAGRAVVEVAQTRQLELRAAVPAESAARLRPGQGATVDSAGVHAVARVIAVAPVVDAATGTATVRLRVDNADGALKAGALARAQVAVAQHEKALLVPRAALLPRNPGADPASDGRLCFVGKDSRAACVPVQTRSAQDGLVEIVSGLDDAQGAAQLIVQGAYALPEGTKVRAGKPQDEEVGAANQKVDASTKEVGTPTKSGGPGETPGDER